MVNELYDLKKLLRTKLLVYLANWLQRRLTGVSLAVTSETSVYYDN